VALLHAGGGHIVPGDGRCGNAPTAFACEHTIEYVLLFDLKRVLDPLSLRIVPFFYWASREGSSAGRRSFAESTLRLIAIFPRRPKVEADTERVLLKFNAQVQQDAVALGRAGIPAICGAPRARALDECYLGCRCVWFSISEAAEFGDVVVSLEPGAAISSQFPISDPLCEKSLQDLFSRAVTFSWREAVDVLATTKPGRGTGFRPWGPHGYKPFYLAVSDERAW
jgi:hypothetical protein